ncbi:uroporphyrinogen-III synthase [Amphritea japonica]|uniref:Uroporphyrinogen-III synthase n=1 Tax=Amphritea japonica ATCC BAA-1530 TaxID=1278309 RepID=A0A7R6SU12_9GAMM|nr:uroporphyrinogen-III synthase [Amphritea japonica]BBB27826.1 uroporphyrinogen-III synthase [Amphritea japonica ATCC BAA-1530]
MPKPRILVTRPAHQAAGQAALLEGSGLEPVLLPLLEITPVDASDPDFNLLKSKVMDLDLYHKVIFISANAVTCGIDLIDQYWPQLPIGIEWLAIGRQTAAQLNSLGITATQPSNGYDSEALLSLPQLQQIATDKILIMRGKGGRETLAEQLSQRGAIVEYADLYRRTAPHYTSEQISSIISNTNNSSARAAPLAAVLITSGEALNNLTQLMTEHSFKPLLHTTLVVPSERVARIAAELGYTRVITASGPDNQAMAETVLSTIDMDDRT